MTTAAVVQQAFEPSAESEVEQLRTQLQEAYRLSRSLRITLLGVHTDVSEALGPVRFESSIRSLKSGLQRARETLDELESKLKG